jgi:hypothetical protein
VEWLNSYWFFLLCAMIITTELKTIYIVKDVKLN